MSSNVRALVRTLLQPLITGNGWSVKPHTVKQLTVLDRTTVYIEHTGIDPLPTAPVACVENSVVVTIVSHKTDYAAAEDALDAKVLDLVNALDAHDRLVWENVRKVEIAEKYLGWAITLTVTTQKEA